MHPRDRFRDKLGCPVCGGLMERLGHVHAIPHGEDVEFTLEEHRIRYPVHPGGPYFDAEFLRPEAPGGKAFGKQEAPKHYAYLTHSCMECGTAAPVEILRPFRGTLSPGLAESLTALGFKVPESAVGT